MGVSNHHPWSPLSYALYVNLFLNTKWVSTLSDKVGQVKKFLGSEDKTSGPLDLIWDHTQDTLLISCGVSKKNYKHCYTAHDSKPDFSPQFSIPLG